MAYNTYSNYPQSYSQSYAQGYPQGYTPNYPQPQNIGIAGQIQNGGFIPAPNEAFARNYPVAPGNSVTFKDETAPYVYTKTMGFSQLETPRFEKYRLVKEENAEQVAQTFPTMPPGTMTAPAEYATKSDFESLKNSIASLKARVDSFEEIKEEVVLDE